MFSNYFDVLILKIIFFNIFLIYFQIKNILKNNCNHTHTMKMISQLRGYPFMCIHQDTSLSFTIAVIIIDTETCGVYIYIYIYY